MYGLGVTLPVYFLIRSSVHIGEARTIGEAIALASSRGFAVGDCTVGNLVAGGFAFIVTRC